MECKVKFDVELPKGRYRQEFSLEQYPAAKSTRQSLTLKQGSNCCKKELRQKKFCSGCGAESPYKTEYKLAKIGPKEYAPIEAQRIDEIDELLPEAKVFAVKELRHAVPVEVEHRTERVIFLAQGDDAKRKAQYCELLRMMEGRAAIGTMTLRSNAFEGVLDVAEQDGQKFLRLRLLVEPEQFNGVPSIEAVAVDSNIVELQKKVLDTVTKDEPYDYTQFRDTAVEQVERIVAAVAMGEALPELKREAEVKTTADKEAELRALLGGAA